MIDFHYHIHTRTKKNTFTQLTYINHMKYMERRGKLLCQQVYLHDTYSTARSPFLSLFFIAAPTEFFNAAIVN